MVKEIERAGIPVVHVCTIVPISLTVGANRIVPAVAIPHPLGNPDLSEKEERAIVLLHPEDIDAGVEALLKRGATIIPSEDVYNW